MIGERVSHLSVSSCVPAPRCTRDSTPRAAHGVPPRASHDVPPPAPHCASSRHRTVGTTRCTTTGITRRISIGIALCGSVGTTWRISTSTTLRGYAAGMVLPAPDGASHLSEMLTLPARAAPSLLASERRYARSAGSTIPAQRSVVT